MVKTPTTRRNSVRIIAGIFRSRKLKFPDVPGLRPTADRIRETLFNWIQDQIPGETCLDMYAGSGAIGFEALSRGAAKVVFVENDKLAGDAITENMKLLQVNNAELVRSNAQQWVAQYQQHAEHDKKLKFGLVFLDPPFADDLVYKTCEQLETSGMLKTNSKIYIETADDLEETRLPQMWTLLKNKKAGSVRYYLYANH